MQKRNYDYIALSRDDNSLRSPGEKSLMDSRSDVRWDPAAREELTVAMGLKTYL